jgi:hypothetical protein
MTERHFPPPRCENLLPKNQARKGCGSLGRYEEKLTVTVLPVPRGAQHQGNADSHSWLIYVESG